MKSLVNLINEKLQISRNKQINYKVTADDLFTVFRDFKIRRGANAVAGVNNYKVFGDFNNLPTFITDSSKYEGYKVCYIGLKEMYILGDDNIIFQVYIKNTNAALAIEIDLKYRKDDVLDFIDTELLQQIIEHVKNS
jgi:hypothetical protein